MAHEEAQLAAIRTYLPEPLSREDIEAHVRTALSESGATKRADTGKVMQRLSAELRGKADLKEVSRMVQELLGA